MSDGVRSGPRERLELTGHKIFGAVENSGFARDHFRLGSKGRRQARHYAPIID